MNCRPKPVLFQLDVHGFTSPSPPEVVQGCRACMHYICTTYALLVSTCQPHYGVPEYIYLE